MTKYSCPCCGQETDKNPRPQFSDRYHKSGNHPLHVKYNQLLDNFNAATKELERSIQEARKLETHPIPRYGQPYVQLIQERETWHDRSSPIIDKVHIVQTLLNMDEKDAWMNRWGSVGGDWSEKRISVSYYRTHPEGILTHDGGGYLLLREPVVITDEEWEQMKSGTIPDRLWRGKEKN